MLGQTQNRDGTIQHFVEGRANISHNMMGSVTTRRTHVKIASSLKTFSHFTWDVQCNNQKNGKENILRLRPIKLVVEGHTL